VIGGNTFDTSAILGVVSGIGLLKNNKKKN
jgi:hypothetical protein